MCRNINIAIIISISSKRNNKIPSVCVGLWDLDVNYEEQKVPQ